MVDKKKTAAVSIEEYNKLKKALAAAEAKIASLPQFDNLTKLPNRALFEDRLSQGMARARRSQRLMAVIFLDINHTKLITAKLGATGKNTLTCEFASRFQAAIRESDTLARIGFDRYAVIMEDVKSQKTVKSIVNKIIESVDNGFEIDGNEIIVSASIGVSFYDGADETQGDLMDDAERALFKAKAAGRSAYEIGGLLAKQDK